jgi:hypothetical protein
MPLLHSVSYTILNLVQMRKTGPQQSDYDALYYFSLFQRTNKTQIEFRQPSQSPHYDLEAQTVSSEFGYPVRRVIKIPSPSFYASFFYAFFCFNAPLEIYIIS